MSTTEIWLLAAGLAMDCLAIAVASGIILKSFYLRPILVSAFAFGFFQAGMLFIGWAGAETFSHSIEAVDHWVAFAILGFLGGRMMWESFKKEKKNPAFDPSSLKVVATLAVATSVDALAAGMSFAFLGIRDFTRILYPVIVVGFVAFAATIFGTLFGIYNKHGHRIRIEFWGGLVLIAIGTKIVIEHLFFQ